MVISGRLYFSKGLSVVKQNAYMTFSHRSTDSELTEIINIVEAEVR